MSSFMEDYNKWKKTGSFNKEKKSLVKTGLTAANYLGQGALKGAESVFVDAPLQIAGGVRKLFGDEKGAKDLFEAANVNLTNAAINKLAGKEANPYITNNQNLFNKQLDENSLIKENNIGGKVVQGIGEMLPTIALTGGISGVGKAAKTAKQLGTARAIGSNALLGTKAFAGATNEAYQESGDIGKSMLYGLGNAAVEIGTEQLSGGIPGLKQIKGDTTKNILKNYGKSVIGEGVEEIASDLANPLLQTIYKGKDALKQYGTADYWKGVAESGLVGSLTGGLLDAPNTISSINTNKALAKASKQKIPGMRTEQSISNNIEALRQEQRETTDNKLKQELATRISGLEQELNQFKLPMASTEGMTLQESASKYNIKPETQSNVQNLMENRGIDSRWDATKFSDNSVNALWTKDVNGNRSVIFNPNASLDTIVEEVAVHELTHDILSSANTTLNPAEILDYVSQLDGYNEARQSLENTYSTMYDPNSAEFNSLIDEEVVADVLGRKLGNQEFINQLVNSKPSIAKSIYNWVVSKLNSIVNKGKVRSEKLYWENIKNNFENAYKQEYKNNEMASTKYKVSDINTDNQGRTLSKQQQEYFKESKVRDENGNLLTVYHGSPNEFNIFDKTKVGKKGKNAWGSGFYFTPNQEYTNKFGDKTKEVYLNITNPYIVADDRELMEIVNMRQDALSNGYDLDDYLKEEGYDGLIVYDEDTDGNDLTEIIAFEPNQIKNINNANPTTNEDIRYSKEAKEWNEFLDKNITTDNQGRELSKQQQEYFKDSKARDENGSLEVVYHGSRNAGFTEFSNNNKIMNKGVNFYTNNENVANTYTGSTEKVDTRKLESIFDAKSWLKGITDEVYIENNRVYDYDGEEILSYENENDLLKNLKRDIQTEFGNTEAGGVYEGYVNITNPLIINGDNNLWSQIPVENIPIENAKELLNKQYYKVKGKLSTSTNDIVRIAQETGNYDGIIFKGIIDQGMYFHKKFNDKSSNVYVTFNSNQFKAVDNTTPTSDPDIRYSKQSEEWDKWNNKTIAPEGTKTKLKDIKQPKKEINLPKSTQTKQKTNLPLVKEEPVLKVNASEIANEMNSVNGKRGWIGTAAQSDVLKDTTLIKDLDTSKLSYVVESNQKSVDTANNHLDTYGYEKSLEDVKSMLRSDKLPKASDVALAERLLQEAIKNGDTKTAQDLIMDIAILGTDLGQATQALSMINRLTPEGQLKMYTKIIERAKARGDKAYQDVEITTDMVQNVLDAYNEDGTYDQQDLNNRVENFKQEIANQMKTTVGEKINAWRYLSMLGNPKTHIRNIVSNVAMNGTIKVKNAMARTLESVLPIANRTKTWKKASTEIQNYANKTAEEMKGIITGENKYNEKTALETKKQVFKNKTLEKLSDFNSNALEAEDWFFSKKAFKNTLQEYLTANGINTLEDIKNNPEVVEKAKIYAVEQAEIATFRQYSKLASAVNSLEKNNKAARLFIEATMPFKKTPINVAKAGVKYSPLGLIKAISYDIYQVKQGNMEASQFIDNLSQGFTGTSLAILGYALAKAGILNGAGGDDKDDKYDSQLGDNQYSLKIGDKSYSISWLSPVAMPLLVGANAYEQLEEKEEWDMNVVSDTLAKTLDPLNEMSFMQGLTNALTSYGSGVDKIKGSLESVGQNYVGQFFPTLFSQFASIIDDKKRSTKASANSTYKFGEQTLRSVMYKLPGLRQQLEVATDIWGNEKEQADNIIQRAYESFIAPYSTTKDITSNLDKEIKKVYNKTGETGVIPSVPYSYIKYKDETYRMSAEEYTKYKKTFGQNANKYLNNLIKSNAYKNATDEDKAKMINNTYDYAKAEANEEYFKGQKINYSSDTLKELNALKNIGINDRSLAEYISNKTLSSTISGDKKLTASEKHEKIANNLINSNLNDKQLAYLYSKYYSTDEKLNNLIELKVPIKEFIKLNSQDIESDYNSNTGKTISNSKKNKVINYINSLNLSVAQKAILIKSQYNSFDSYNNEIINYVNNLNKSVNDKKVLLKSIGFDNYDKDVINYINSQNITKKEKEAKLKSLGFTIRDGRVYSK